MNRLAPDLRRKLRRDATYGTQPRTYNKPKGRRRDKGTADRLEGLLDVRTEAPPGAPADGFRGPLRMFMINAFFTLKLNQSCVVF